MINVSGVVFDLDHTLFNRYATFEALQNDIYNSLRKYLLDNVTPRDMYIALKNADKKYLYHGWDMLAKSVFETGYFKTLISEKEFKDIILSCFYLKAIPYSFTIPTLRFLKEKGFKIGLITNGKSNLQRKKLQMLNLENEFDEIIVSGEFGKDKPDLSIFTEMSKRLNISENQLIYVGDHPVHDIDASSKAGYKTAWVKSNGTWIDGCSKPDCEINTIEELKNLITLSK